MKVGLIGFGYTGKAVAAVLLRSKEFQLQWVLRQSREMEHRRAGDYLGIHNDEPGRIYSAEQIAMDDLLELSPVDAVIDVSVPEAIQFYGEAACRRGITVISAISHYPAELLDYLAHLACHTRIIHSPYVRLGLNFMNMAARVSSEEACGNQILFVLKNLPAKARGLFSREDLFVPYFRRWARPAPSAAVSPAPAAHPLALPSYRTRFSPR